MVHSINLNYYNVNTSEGKYYNATEFWTAWCINRSINKSKLNCRQQQSINEQSKLNFRQQSINTSEQQNFGQQLHFEALCHQRHRSTERKGKKIGMVNGVLALVTYLCWLERRGMSAVVVGGGLEVSIGWEYVKRWSQ